jgi:hypothetical protein
VAAILKRAGVPDADAQTLATEPPMETMVMDSVDAPDADAAGPGQEAAQLAPVATALVQAKIAEAEAQQANAHKVDQHVQDQTFKADQHVRAAELHQEHMRKAKAEADLAEKKAKESSFKPKPAAAKPKPKPKGSGR